MSQATVDQKIEIPWSGVGAVYTKEEMDLVQSVMENTFDTFTQGKYQNQFQDAFSAFCGVPHSYAVATCTSALDIAATLCRFEPGDEVIIPGHTYCATAIPFGRHGASIVWADIDPETLVVTTETILEKITPRTKAIVVVHLYGSAVDMPAIMALAKEKDLIVIEDCAQALGAKVNGQRVGSFGDLGCFSFHTHKNITTLGEGGMLTTTSDEFAALIPGLRHNGHAPYASDRESYWKPAMVNVDIDIEGVWPQNHCLGEVQCALGTKILDRVDALIDQRRARAEQFIQAFHEYPELKFQSVPDHIDSAWHLLPAFYDDTVTGKSNDDFIKLMSEEYLVKVIAQYYPLYRYPLFESFGFGDSDCPNTDRFYDNMVSFPFHSWMPEDHFQYMIQTTKDVLNSFRETS